MYRSRLLCAIVWTLTLPLMSSVATAQVEVADGEREFIQQLLDRAMFDLAEQFCRRQMVKPANVSQQAEWELILSECQQQHAWHVDDDSRNDMVSQSALRITEFLRSNTPFAEKEILLRVRQIELLTAAGQMEETIQAPLSNSFVLDAAAQEAWASARTMRLSASAKFAMEAVAQAQVTAEALMKQIDEIRRDVDGDVVRLARERIRAALAQIMFVRARLSPASESAGLLDQADAMAEQLQKSASDDSVRFRARLMLADIQLDRKDFAAFNLRFGNVTSSAGSPDETAAVTALKIRSLLKQGQPSEALQEFVQASRDGFPLTQELQTLRLQGLLQLLELLFQLDESARRSELQQKTVDEFLQLKDSTLAATNGIWRQRCVRIINRFDRVQKVGPEAAFELEQAALLVDSGDIRQARQSLQALVQRVGTRNPRLVATVLLQSGNLAVRLRDWTSASVDLLTSRESFLAEKDESAAAAADLLRVYVIGQQWNSEPAAGMTEADYREAIEEHLQKFSGQPTARKIREWRARLLRSADPLKSAEELLELVEGSTTTADSVDPKDANAKNPDLTPGEIVQTLNLLCLAGDHLLEAMSGTAAAGATVSADNDKVFHGLCGRFISQVKVLHKLALNAELPQWEILAAQQIGLSLGDFLPTETNWKMQNAESRRLRVVLSDRLVALQPQQTPNAGTPSQTSEADELLLTSHGITVCDAMIILSSVRQLADSTDYESSRASLLTLSIAERFRTTRLMLRQLNSAGKPVPGDSQLAHLLIDLMTPASPDTTAMTIEQRITQLRILQPLCRAVTSTAAFDRCLDDVLSLVLTDSQIESIAEIVTQTPTAQGTRSSAETARRFWQSVLKRTKPGQDTWLEASLQLALLAEAAGDRRESAKIIGVISVLHPEWGSAARKSRADELRLRLEKFP